MSRISGTTHGKISHRKEQSARLTKLLAVELVFNSSLDEVTPSPVPRIASKPAHPAFVRPERERQWLPPGTRTFSVVIPEQRSFGEAR
jgi:hypothetical protein